MAAKGYTYLNDLLNLIFNAQDLPSGLARNASPGNTQLWIALHTASPAGSGTQQSNEAGYPGYARVAVNRDSSGFTVAFGQASLVNPVTFPVSTGSPNETETYFSIGTAASGSSNLLYFGQLTPPITVNEANITPQIAAGALVTES